MRSPFKIALCALLINTAATAAPLSISSDDYFTTSPAQQFGDLQESAPTLAKPATAQTVEALMDMVNTTEIQDLKQVKNQADQVISVIAPYTNDGFQEAVTNLASGAYHTGKAVVQTAKVAAQILPPALGVAGGIMALDAYGVYNSGKALVYTIQDNIDQIYSVKKNFVKGMGEFYSGTSYFWNAGVNYFYGS